ncbi:MAG: hypothetical protein HUK09_09155 [Bacteroidaceae bacterium]|nr:hypothetical protein [Bacteroidaceae bacterium]
MPSNASNNISSSTTDFPHIGRRLPYAVPEGFFEASRERILAATVGTCSATPADAVAPPAPLAATARPQRPIRLRPLAWMSAAAAAVIVVAVAWWARPASISQPLADSPEIAAAMPQAPPAAPAPAATPTPSETTKAAKAPSSTTSTPRPVAKAKSSPAPASTQLPAADDPTLNHTVDALSPDEQDAWLSLAEADVFFADGYSAFQ